MITVIKDSIQNVGTRDPSWVWFGFALSFNQCNLEWGADLEGLHNFTQVHITMLISPRTTREKSLNGRPEAEGATLDKPDTNDGRVKN
jgi:hypothetical protein